MLLWLSNRDGISTGLDLTWAHALAEEVWAESVCCRQDVHTTAHLACARQIRLWLVRRLRSRCEHAKGWLHALAK